MYTIQGWNKKDSKPENQSMCGTVRKQKIKKINGKIETLLKIINLIVERGKDGIVDRIPFKPFNRFELIRVFAL